MTDSTPKENSTWYLFDTPMGRTARSPTCASLHILCPDCGKIWARVESDRRNHWTCSHRSCPSCGLGTLLGVDWTSQPYAPLNLPYNLLTRELDIASSRPKEYTSFL